MTKYTLCFIVMMALLFSCQPAQKNKHNPLEQELMSLKTEASKQQYLEQILIDDQNVRGSRGSELMLEYGQNSPEHMEYIRAQWRQDSINLKKIEKYMELYGYPDKSLGDKATTTPWMVIHHSQDYETRKKHFGTIYKAFLDGHIDDGAVSFYLGRMFQMKNGERLKMKNPYRSEEELDTLIKELNLENERNKVINK